MNDVHSYMQSQAGLMDASSAHDLDFLNFDDRGPFLSKYEANDSHGLFSNSINGFTVSQYSGDNIQLTTSELLNESSSHHYTNSSEINSHDNSPTNLPDLALYNHNNEKMTSINPKIAHPDLQPFMPEDNGVNLGMNNFQTIFEEASAKDTESNFGNLEMRKDARSYQPNYVQYNTAEVDDEKTDDECEENALLAGNKYRRGKKDIAWRWTWLNLQIAELHKQIQMCDNLLHNIQVEKEIIPADLGRECARTAGLRINKRVKIVKLTPPVQSTNKQFHPLFVPSLANVPSLNAPQAPARPRGKQDYPMSPPRTAPRRKDLAMSTPNGPRANANNKSLKNSTEPPRKKLTKSDPRNNIRRSTPSRPRDREYDVDNVILPGRVSSLRRSVDKTPKEIFTPTFRIMPELTPEEEWKKYEEDHRAKKARKQLRDEAKEEAKQMGQAPKVQLPTPIGLTESYLDSASMEDDDDILLIKTSLESSPTSDKSRSHAVDTSLDADSIRIESMASIDRAEALKSFQATFEQSQALWKHESTQDADSQSVNSNSNSPVLLSAPVPQLPVSCEDNSQCNRQNSNHATTQLAEEDSESSSYSSDEEDITDLSFALRHFRSELKERIRWEKPDPTSPHYNTYMKEEEFLVSRLFQSYTAHPELGQRLPPELWQDNIVPDEEELSFSYMNDKSDEESSHTSHNSPVDGLRPRRKRPLESPSSESSHPPKRARVERRDDDFIRDYDRHITGLNV
jgi:hypothetical protein